jgi:hypothetical protein
MISQDIFLSNACRRSFVAGPPQLLPSIFADSLQAINCKFGNIVDCESITSDIVFSKRLTCLEEPVDPSDAANKEYVDNVAGSAKAAPPANSI